MIPSPEQALSVALREVHAALVAGDVLAAARSMREAVSLCDEAQRNAVPVSPETVRELQRLFESCLEANHRLGQELGERLAAGSRSNVARRAYGARRLPKVRNNG